MAYVFKCKMCGGDVQLVSDLSHGTCEFCGSTMTFPKVTSEQRLNLFNRANYFRLQNEFDKAVIAYEQILETDERDAEAHWGIVLSRYGIEYVEDPKTHKRIPTCHRMQPVSILNDTDYKLAVRYAADKASKDLYISEGEKISKIQEQYLEITAKEKPYDVFICYKESDDNGQRTVDSTIAQEIYEKLSDRGYNTFFARISLENKLGEKYEPYIFSALSSSKVMLVVGTSTNNINSVWVRNEWSRFLQIMKNDRRRVIIPCYRGMSPYDLPEEMAILQSQDMGKVGAIQDLVRGIEKIIGQGEAEQIGETIVQSANTEIDLLLRRARLFVDNKEWENADQYAERILDIDAEHIEACYIKIVAGHSLCNDVSLYVKIVNRKSSNLPNNAKMLITEENCVEWLWVFLSYQMDQATSYVLQKHPEILSMDFPFEENPHASLLSYVMFSKYKKSGLLLHIVEVLLENGADPNSERCNIKDGKEEHFPCLFTAAISLNNMELTRLFLQKEADPNAYMIWENKGNNSSGKNHILNEVVNSTQNIEMLKELIRRGANVEKGRIYKKNGKETIYTPLSDAIWNQKNIDLVRVLIENGADVNHVTEIAYEDGSIGRHSMLTDALWYIGDVNIMNLLLQSGATWDNVVTIKGESAVEREFPYQFEKFNVNWEVMREIKRNGWKGSRWGEYYAMGALKIIGAILLFPFRLIKEKLEEYGFL